MGFFFFPPSPGAILFQVPFISEKPAVLSLFFIFWGIGTFESNFIHVYIFILHIHVQRYYIYLKYEIFITWEDKATKHSGCSWGRLKSLE